MAYSRLVNSRFFRDAAWQQLSGNWGSVMILTLVYMAITMIAQSLPALGLLLIVLLFPLDYSFSVLYLDNKRNNTEFNVDALFEGYREMNDVKRIIGTYLLVYLYTVLWTLLFIIPGIIKSISYSMVPYILKDNPEMKYNAAIERSMAMMHGYKLKYFILILSFIGWMLLVAITFGLASFFVTPYMTASYAHFYEYVKEEYEKKMIG